MFQGFWLLDNSNFHLLSVTSYLHQGHMETEAYPSWHWARVGVTPGQVSSSSQDIHTKWTCYDSCLCGRKPADTRRTSNNQEPPSCTVPPTIYQLCYTKITKKKLKKKLIKTLKFLTWCQEFGQCVPPLKCWSILQTFKSWSFAYRFCIRTHICV